MAHNSSLSFKIFVNSSLNSFSKPTRKLLGLVDRAVWTPLSLATTLFLWWKIFPKTSLFHTLAFFVNLVIPLGNTTRLFQASRTTFGNLGCDNHLGWNLKGRWSLTYWLCSRQTSIGQWLDWTLSRCLTLASG